MSMLIRFDKSVGIRCLVWGGGCALIQSSHAWWSSDFSVFKLGYNSINKHGIGLFMLQFLIKLPSGEQLKFIYIPKPVFSHICWVLNLDPVWDGFTGMFFLLIKRCQTSYLIESWYAQFDQRTLFVYNIEALMS